MGLLNEIAARFQRDAGGARVGAVGMPKVAGRTRKSGLGADAAETIARIVRRCVVGDRPSLPVYRASWLAGPEDRFFGACL